MSTMIIEPRLRMTRYWREAWAFRAIAYSLARRDLALRYKQTILGLLWALIRPISFMLVLTVVFAVFAGLKSGGMPYPLIVLSGIVCWQFAVTIVSQVSACIIGSTNLISKVYFPRVLIPAGSSLSALADLGVALGVMLAFMLALGVMPTWRVIYLPLFAALTLAIACGAGLWLAVITVRYRDVMHIIPVAVQLSMYLSPVGFLSSNVPEKYRRLYELNPLVGVIDGFRYALLGPNYAPSLQALAVSCAAAVVFMALGLRSFIANESGFADEI